MTSTQRAGSERTTPPGVDPYTTTLNCGASAAKLADNADNNNKTHNITT
jgi:hypothetical protein